MAQALEAGYATSNDLGYTLPRPPAPHTKTRMLWRNGRGKTSGREGNGEVKGKFQSDLPSQMGLPLRTLRAWGNAQQTAGEEDIRCQVPPSFWGPWRPTWSAHFSSPYPRPYPPTCYFSELLGLPGGNILANRKSYSRENAKPPSVPPLKAHPSGASRQGQLDGLPSPHQSPNDIQGLHMTLDPFGNAFGPEALRSDDQVAAPLYGATSSNVHMGSFSPQDSTFDLATNQVLLTPQDVLHLQNALSTPQSTGASANPLSGQYHFMSRDRTPSRTSTPTVDLSHLGVPNGPSPQVSDQPELQDLEDVDGEPLEIFDDVRTPATFPSSRNSPAPKAAQRATALPVRDINTRIQTTTPTPEIEEYKHLSILQEYSRKAGFCPKCAAGNCSGVESTRACRNPCFLCQKAECNGYGCSI